MNTRHTVLATVIGGLFSSAAMAATDCSLGSNSTGNTAIDLEILDSVEISALNDIDFGQYGGTDTGADEIDNSVKLASAATGADSVGAVTYNCASATFNGSGARDCGAANNASVDISITEAELRAASTDTYADTLILQISPI